MGEEAEMAERAATHREEAARARERRLASEASENKAPVATAALSVVNQNGQTSKRMIKRQRKVLKTYKDEQGYDVSELVTVEEEVEVEAGPEPVEVFGIDSQFKKRERDLEAEWEERYLPKEDLSPTKLPHPSKRAKDSSSPPKKTVQKGIGAFFTKL